MNDSSLAKLIDENSLNVIRNTISNIKNEEQFKWKTLALRIDPAEDLYHVLSNFVRRHGTPRIVHLRKYVSYIDEYLSENPLSPALSLYREHISDKIEKPDRSAEADRYEPFKKMLEISDNEQQKLSEEISGTYFGIRRSKDDRYVISHINIANTFRKRGLPLCRISRKRFDGLGDMTIDGSVWKKNQHIYMLGYERPSGHVRTIHLTPIDPNYNFGTGMTSGFDGNGFAFSAQLNIVRAKKDIVYTACKEFTGIFEGSESAASGLVRLGLTEDGVSLAINNLRENSYIHVPLD